MGIETEYGISLPGQASANPMVASSQIVNAYASYAAGQTHERSRRARWDFEEENPLRDARGFELPREQSDHSDDDLGLALGLNDAHHGFLHGDFLFSCRCR